MALTPAHVFGVKADVAGGLACVDDEGTLLAVAGGYLARAPRAGGAAPPEFAPLLADGGGAAGATAMALSTTRRFVAVAERAAAPRPQPPGAPPQPPPPRATVALYNVRTMQRRRIIAAGAALGAPLAVVDVAFSCDDAALLVVGGAPTVSAAAAVFAGGGAPAGALDAPTEDAAASRTARAAAPSIAIFAVDSGELLASTVVTPPQPAIGGGGLRAGGASAASLSLRYLHPHHHQQQPVCDAAGGGGDAGGRASSASSAAGGSHGSDDGGPAAPAAATGAPADEEDLATVSGLRLARGSRGSLGGVSVETCGDGGGSSGSSGAAAAGDEAGSAASALAVEHHEGLDTAAASAEAAAAAEVGALGSTSQPNHAASSQSLVGTAQQRGSFRHSLSSARLLSCMEPPLQEQPQHGSQSHRAGVARHSLRGARLNPVALTPPVALTAAGTSASFSGSSGGLGPCAVVFGECLLSFFAVVPVPPGDSGGGGSGGGSASACESALGEASPTPPRAIPPASAAAAAATTQPPSPQPQCCFALQQLPLCPKLREWLCRYGGGGGGSGGGGHSPHLSFRCAEWLDAGTCIVGTGAGDVLVFDALGALADVLPPPPPAQPTLPPRSIMSSSAPASAGAPPGAERPATSASGATCATDAFEDEQAEKEGEEPAGEGAAAACSPALWADGGGLVAPGSRPSRAGGASVTGGGAARIDAAGCSTAGSFGRLLPPAIGAPTHPSSIESIVVNRGGSSAAPPAGAAAGPSRTWRFATAGSGGVVYFYAAAVAPARPASSQTPRRLLPRWDYPPLRPTAAAVLSTTAAPPSGAAAAAFRLAATAALPAAWEADATDVTIRRLCAAPSGGAVYVAVGGCHVFSVSTAKLAAPAAAAASPHAHRGGDHVQCGGEGASPRGGGDTATRDYTGADDDHQHSRLLQPPPPPLSSSLQPAHVTAPVVELPAMEPVEQLAAHDPPASAFVSGRGDGAAAALTSCLAPSAALAGSGAATGGGAPGGSAILSMDVAVRRPLVATVGPGGWLHVWNFAARTRELARVLPDAPGHVTMHPSGLSVAVSAPDRVSVLTLLLGDVKEAACVPLRGAAVLRYSRGGTLLAVAAGPVVHVLDGATLAFVVALRGHTGRVTQVTWAHNDATLLTVGADGALYEWDVREGKRAREFLHKGARVWGAAASMDGGTVYAVCTITEQHGGDSDAAGGGGAGGASDAPVSRHALLEVDMHRGALVSEAPLPWPAACVAASQGTEQPMLFVGCAATACVGGAVRSLALPLSEGAGAGATVGGPAAGCVAMQLSVDGARLFVAGCDGSLVVYDVRDRDGRVPLSDASAKAPWCDEVLVAVADYEERKAEARELREQLAELASNSDYAVRVKEIAFRDQIKALTERCVRASARGCGGGVCRVARAVGGMRWGAKRCCAAVGFA